MALTARSPSIKLSIQSPAVFAVVRTSTRTAVKEFVLASLWVLFAPVAFGGTTCFFLHGKTTFLVLSMAVPALAAREGQAESVAACQAVLSKRCKVIYFSRKFQPEEKKKNRSPSGMSTLISQSSD